MTYALSNELSNRLVGLKVDKVCQPERDEIDLLFHFSGRNRLIINCTASTPYMALSNQPPKNQFSKALFMQSESRGMGALGLPGDLSSQSRFVRACFTKLNSKRDNKNAVSQFFHILGTVNQVSGCCVTENGDFEKTIYTSCYNADKGIFYYTTYHNRQITAVDIHQENLDSDRLITYPLQNSEQIQYQNKKWAVRLIFYHGIKTELSIFDASKR